ncbi:UDP-N-acetylmuramate--L-alanine ligase [Candidatus Shapirobacteria bacterium]|nr:UDP-N-acetylmuramate--L-alanine ligase [Candidatus Shapirobacteria bacterium]
MIKKLSLRDIHSVHFTGIKGVGMTALACCFQDLGIRITGSDIQEVFVTDEILRKRRIIFKIGFSAKNLENPDLLITTGAHGGLLNPEVKAAKKRGIPVMTHGEALGFLMKPKRGISVCGVGGKSTTSAMAATALSEAGLAPSYAVGVAEIFPLGFPGRFEKKSEFFIAEADEYATCKGLDSRPRFFWQNPEFIICTNIEYDHPDIYPNIAATKKTFLNFFQKIPSSGFLIINGDNPNNQDVLNSYKGNVFTYGEDEKNQWQIKNIIRRKEKNNFSLYYQNKKEATFSLSVPGQYNILNAAAVIILGKSLGLSYKILGTGIKKFKGTKRRFEKIGENQKITLYDDYAHHPSEIKATLRAARERFGQKQRVITIFQPHTFSRTKYLLKDFGIAFKSADIVVIAPIYASAREEQDSSITPAILAQEIGQHQKEVYFVNNLKDLVPLVKKIAQKGDVIFTIGAGDIWKIGKKLLKKVR